MLAGEGELRGQGDMIDVPSDEDGHVGVRSFLILSEPFTEPLEGECSLGYGFQG